MTDGPNSIRRIVTIDDESGKSFAIADGPTPDVRSDPVRPGFASARIWVTESSPVRIAQFRDPVSVFPHTIEPPRRGSVCRIVTFPPDDVFRGKVGAREVAAYFRAMGSPGASTYSPRAPHPYMQKTQTLDFCLVLEGEITLVLDTAEVHLKAGDTVVQRGTDHAWSNRSSSSCRIAISSHDAAR
jgi:mannose-6-phosphate isomerase-like protein (cupin superfamily)